MAAYSRTYSRHRREGTRAVTSGTLQMRRTRRAASTQRTVRAPVEGGGRCSSSTADRHGPRALTLPTVSHACPNPGSRDPLYAIFIPRASRRKVSLAWAGSASTFQKRPMAERSASTGSRTCEQRPALLFHTHAGVSLASARQATRQVDPPRRPERRARQQALVAAGRERIRTKAPNLRPSRACFGLL